jgi:hypothetical protein
MKIIKKNQTIEIKNSENCLAIEYPLGDKDINGAVIELIGRYPNTGRVVNLICKEIGYVISGSGKIVVENEAISLSEGDMILVEPGEKYFWEGNLKLFAPCTPAWYLEQHKEVE